MKSTKYLWAYRCYVMYKDGDVVNLVSGLAVARTPVGIDDMLSEVYGKNYGGLDYVEYQGVVDNDYLG